MQPQGIVARNDVPVRTKENLPLEIKSLWGEIPPVVEIAMNGLRLQADLERWPEDRSLSRSAPKLPCSAILGAWPGPGLLYWIGRVRPSSGLGLRISGGRG